MVSLSLRLSAPAGWTCLLTSAGSRSSHCVTRPRYTQSTSTVNPASTPHLQHRAVQCVAIQNSYPTRAEEGPISDHQLLATVVRFCLATIPPPAACDSCSCRNGTVLDARKPPACSSRRRCCLSRLTCSTRSRKSFPSKTCALLRSSAQSPPTHRVSRAEETARPWCRAVGRERRGRRRGGDHSRPGCGMSWPK